VPRDAVAHFQGDDPKDGPILRYTMVNHAAHLPHLGASDPTFQEAHQRF